MIRMHWTNSSKCSYIFYFIFFVQGSSAEWILSKIEWSADIFKMWFYCLFFLMVIGEDWKKARAMNSSSLHLLQPLDIDLQLGKAMVERDSRMPRWGLVQFFFLLYKPLYQTHCLIYLLCSFCHQFSLTKTLRPRICWIVFWNSNAVFIYTLLIVHHCWLQIAQYCFLKQYLVHYAEWTT